MLCPNCNNENLEDNVFCNKCGAKLQDISTNEENKNKPIQEANSLISRAKRNLKKIVFAVIGIIVITGSIGGYKVYANNKQVKQVQLYHQQYELNFAKTTINILTETYLCGQMCTQVSDTWRVAIEITRKDFNTELVSLHNQWDSNGLLKERETAKNNIEKNMKQLQNPPKDYEETYKLFVDLYSIYGQIYSQATSPQGSLVSYNQDINQKMSQFNQLYDKIKVIKPNIETLGKKK